MAGHTRSAALDGFLTLTWRCDAGNGPESCKLFSHCSCIDRVRTATGPKSTIGMDPGTRSIWWPAFCRPENSSSTKQEENTLMVKCMSPSPVSTLFGLIPMTQMLGDMKSAVGGQVKGGHSKGQDNHHPTMQCHAPSETKQTHLNADG